MTNIPPPYRPLRGAEPPHFVDRAEGDDICENGIVAGSIAAFAAGTCDPRFHRLVTSRPAMGRTALLRAIGQEAARRLGWAVCFHSCQPKERALGPLAAEIESAVLRRWPVHAGRFASESTGFLGTEQRRPCQRDPISTPQTLWRCRSSSVWTARSPGRR